MFFLAVGRRPFIDGTVSIRQWLVPVAGGTGWLLALDFDFLGLFVVCWLCCLGTHRRPLGGGAIDA